MNIKRLSLGLLVVSATLILLLRHFGFLKTSVEFTPRAYGVIQGARVTPTHVFYDTLNNVEILSDFSNNRFVYRSLSADKDPTTWQQSEMASLRQPHAITYHPSSKKYFAVDTGNHQIIAFDSIADNDEGLKRYTELSGHSLGKRPHDIAYNTVDDHIYVVLAHGIIRFRPSDAGIGDVHYVSRDTITNAIRKKTANPDFSIGYMRALSVVNGVIYLVNTTQGNIVEMEDFTDSSTWSARINQDQSMKYSESGSFEKDGLILNDIEYFNGYWYASNYYPSAQNRYIGSENNMTNKVMRWESWEDFERSNWEDLSHLIHPESIPYFFSTYDDRLFISMFHGGNKEGVGSGVYEISDRYFCTTIN